ncbi:hypothetical protein OUZ56_013811 [Daphnia magna]|uniref:Secreted protein n=1 Tax=Daphnia magna TaxID=35525 RepID=A0ABQ9Z701_9CRUS|nr:hypothetical protein OUZ56_013811 [Daphnia magna]
MVFARCLKSSISLFPSLFFASSDFSFRFKDRGVGGRIRNTDSTNLVFSSLLSYNKKIASLSGYVTPTLPVFLCQTERLSTLLQVPFTS